MEEKYLTEMKLGKILNLLFPHEEFIHNKMVPGSGIKNRPDYRCEKLKLIVEFDGYQHYTKCCEIKKDEYKDKAYKKLGYDIVRIPNFIQITTETIKHLFELTID